MKKNKNSRKVKSNKKSLAILGISIAVVVIVAAVFAQMQTTNAVKDTYFSYSAEEADQLKDLNATGEVDLADVYQWDQKYFRLIADQKLNDVEASRIYAYLAVAEADFVALTSNAKGKPAGSINTIAQGVACEFFPTDCASMAIDEMPDALSKRATELVVAQIKARRAQDAQMTKPLALKDDPALWQGPDPKVGIDAATRKPWHLTSGDQYRVVPPPDAGSAEYTRMLAEVKQALANITEPQRQAVVFWAGGPGTKTPPGIWLNLADQYMQDQGTDLDTVLAVRSRLTTAMADSVIAVFDSKYSYQRKRPVMLDKSIVTVMPTPNHPSYPAGHATISASAYVVLSHYFPEHKDTWKQKADEASVSRTWGGIHFPIDNQAGFELGEKVGNQALAAKR